MAIVHGPTEGFESVRDIDFDMQKERGRVVDQLLLACTICMLVGLVLFVAEFAAGRRTYNGNSWTFVVATAAFTICYALRSRISVAVKGAAMVGSLTVASCNGFLLFSFTGSPETTGFAAVLLAFLIFGTRIGVAVSFLICACALTAHALFSSGDYRAGYDANAQLREWHSGLVHPVGYMILLLVVVRVGMSTLVTRLGNAFRRLHLVKAKYDRALNATQDGLWEYRFDTDDTEYSESFVRLLRRQEIDWGWDRAGFLSLVHPDDLGRCKETFERFREGQEKRDIDFRLLCGDGKYRWFHSRSRVERDKYGNPRVAIGSIRNIDEQKELRAALETLVHGTSGVGQAFFRSLVRELASVIGVKYVLVGQVVPNHGDDRIRTVALWNQGDFGENFEYKLRGTPCDDAVKDQVCFVRSEVQARYPDDVLLADMNVESYLGIAMISSEQRPIGLIAILHDEPLERQELAESLLRVFAGRGAAEMERLEAERQVHELNDTLEQRVEERTNALRKANADLDAYARSVAHDLRAPLRAMYGFAEALREDYADKLDVEGREYTQSIEQSAYRMDQLISDLLDYSRVGKDGASLEEVQIDEVIRGAIEQLAPVVEQSGAKITTLESNQTVYSHRNTIQQVLVNLLSNAIKFVANGTTPEIEVRTERVNGLTRVSVIDNGVGIEAEHHHRVFKVFERLEENDSLEGTGIGLAIVKRSMESLGGNCGVESVPGRGSSFWIDLPASLEPPAPADVASHLEYRSPAP